MTIPTASIAEIERLCDVVGTIRDACLTVKWASFIPRVGYKLSMLLGLALVAVACALTPSVASFRFIKVLFACIGTAYAIMMWTLIGMTIGVCKRLFSRPSIVVRYIADASYWLYLIHLPIVVWLQITFAELPLHWAIKWLSVTGLTLAIGLISYQLLVRRSVIGVILNGKKRTTAATSEWALPTAVKAKE